MRDVSTEVSPSLWVEQIRKALAWPSHALEARRVRAELAALSERELQDIGWTRRDDCIEPAVVEGPAERASRARAVRAWYGHDKKAA